MLYGAIEAGGTKMICGIGDKDGNIIEKVSIPTKTPEITMPEIVKFLKKYDIKAIGIACFGPIDLDRNSKTYGYITSTPKVAWQNFDFVGYLSKEFGIPIGFDTDVNGSLLGELTYGDIKGINDAVYITIGTGIGAGIMSNGKLVHGMLHPEAGHIILPIREDDNYEGRCPFHKNCFEGLASGPAVEERWNESGKNLSDRKEVWDLEAHYIAMALMNYILIMSPRKIILGGGIMNQQQLFPLVREKVVSLLNGYIKSKEIENIETYIVPASLNGDQGLLGALKLGIDEYVNFMNNK